MTEIFRKSLDAHGVAAVEALFLHARAVHAALKDIPGCAAPEPLAWDPQGLDYERLALPSRSLWEEIRDGACPVALLGRAGGLLAHLHGNTARHDGTCVLHGDFVPHNLFLMGVTLVAIDAHPPEHLPFRQDLLEGLPLRDLVSFVTCLFSNAGARVLWRNREYYRLLAQAFLEGYRAVRPLPQLTFGVFCDRARDMIAMKRRAGVHFVRAFLHGAGYSLLGFLLPGPRAWT